MVALCSCSLRPDLRANIGCLGSIHDGGIVFVIDQLLSHCSLTIHSTSPVSSVHQPLVLRDSWCACLSATVPPRSSSLAQGPQEPRSSCRLSEVSSCLAQRAAGCEATFLG